MDIAIAWMQAAVLVATDTVTQTVLAVAAECAAVIWLASF